MEVRNVTARIIRRYNVMLAPGQSPEAFLSSKKDTFTLSLGPLGLVFNDRKVSFKMFKRPTKPDEKPREPRRPKSHLIMSWPLRHYFIAHQRVLCPSVPQKPSELYTNVRCELLGFV
jgi:hypothetical protein